MPALRVTVDAGQVTQAPGQLDGDDAGGLVDVDQREVATVGLDGRTDLRDDGFDLFAHGVNLPAVGPTASPIPSPADADRRARPRRPRQRLRAPEWVLESGLVLVAALTRLALPDQLATAPAGRGRGRPAAAGVTAALLRGLTIAAAAVGIALWAVVLTGGLFAVDDLTENPAPASSASRSSPAASCWRPCRRLVAGGQPVRHPRPASSPSGAADRRPCVGRPGAARHPAVVDARPSTTAARCAGSAPGCSATPSPCWPAVLWGRAWVARRRGHRGALGAAGGWRRSPVTPGPPARVRATADRLGGGRLVPGTAEALLLTAGTAVYSAIHRLDWFQLEVMGVGPAGADAGRHPGPGARGRRRPVVWWAAAGARADDAAPLVPLAIGVATAFLLTDLLIRDRRRPRPAVGSIRPGWTCSAPTTGSPIRRGSPRPPGVGRAGRALAIGTVGAVIVAHDRGLAAGPDRAIAERPTARVVAAVTVLATAALVVLLR